MGYFSYISSFLSSTPSSSYYIIVLALKLGGVGALFLYKIIVKIIIAENNIASYNIKLNTSYFVLSASYVSSVVAVTNKLVIAYPIEAPIGEEASKIAVTVGAFLR